MHNIEHFTVGKTEHTPGAILKYVNKWAFDPRESSGYHGNLKFHESPVYSNREEAEKAIERLDRGWYDDHAVLYKEGRKLMWLVKVEWHS